MVGHGASAKVHQVQLCKTREVVAVKSFDANHFGAAQNELEVFQELSSISNPFVAKFIAAEEDEEHVHIMMQFCAGGDLFRRFECLRQQRVDISEHVVFYMAELVHALHIMHTNQIVLNDLKTENVALDEHGHVCLIDFGVSSLQVRHDCQLRQLNGSVHCIPPEKAQHQGYGAPADMFALGCLLYELCTGQRPSAYYENKKRGSQVDADVVQQLEDPYRDAIKVLTSDDPVQRPSAARFKSHELFRGVDWNKVANKEVKAPWTPNSCEEHALDPDAFDPAYVEKPDFSVFGSCRVSM